MDESRHQCIKIFSARISQILLFAIVCLAILVTPQPAEASTANFSLGSYAYSIDGQHHAMNVTPYSKNDRTYLPIRYAAYAIGIGDQNIIWDGINQTATLVKGDTVVQVQLGSKMITVNNVASAMDVAPESANGRTMLPIRWVAEAFGSTVAWDNITQTIQIHSTSAPIRAATNLGSRSNPIAGNNDLILPFQTTSFKPMKTVKIQLQGIIAGDEAKRLAAENPINKIPKSNQEWRFYIFDLSHLVGTDLLAAKDIINDQNLFTPSGSAVKVYEYALLGETDLPHSFLNVKLEPGKSSRVVYGVLVDKTAGYPLLQVKYNAGLSSNWIALK